MILAPWIKPTDVLAAIGEGSRVGLSARQADQAAARAAAEQARADERAASEDQNAAARLKYSYDALAQARQEQLDKAAEVAAAQKLKESSAADLSDYRTRMLQNQGDRIDDLNDYRSGVLKNQADRISYLTGRAGASKTYHVGDHLVQVDPVGGVKTLFSVPSESKIPMVSGVPAIADDPASPKLRLRADDPLLNKLMGTNASMLGTNFVMPKIAPRVVAPSAPAAPTAPATKFQKGMRAVQNGKTFEFDGDKWNRVDNLSEDDAQPSADEIDTSDEPAADEEA